MERYYRSKGGYISDWTLYEDWEDSEESEDDEEPEYEFTHPSKELLNKAGRAVANRDLDNEFEDNGLAEFMHTKKYKQYIYSLVPDSVKQTKDGVCLVFVADVKDIPDSISDAFDKYVCKELSGQTSDGWCGDGFEFEATDAEGRRRRYGYYPSCSYERIK